MHLDVNGTRLWFDVDGPGLVPDGSTMRERPTILAIHGGPGSYDHSYLKPHLSALTDVAQVVYLDLREHGRSGRHDPEAWTLELCADDAHAFCEALGIDRPIVYGHSMGGFVAQLYGIRHPVAIRGLILHGTMARFDLERIVEGFRAAAGDTVAELARRAYGNDDVTDAEWARVYPAFGPNVPDAETLARVVHNHDIDQVGSKRMDELDLLDQLWRVTAPTLVCVGTRDAVTPVSASEEIMEALPAGVGRLVVFDDAGHFSWLDQPDRLWAEIRSFVASLA